MYRIAIGSSLKYAYSFLLRALPTNYPSIPLGLDLLPNAIRSLVHDRVEWKITVLIRQHPAPAPASLYCIPNFYPIPI